MGNKGSFVFYTEYREHLSMLPPEQVGELMFALMDYQETGEVPDLPKGSALAMCFSFIKKRMDKDNSKYEERCERNRSNGKKGGRPAKETDNTETEENPNKPNGFSENRTVISETEENPTEPKKPIMIMNMIMIVIMRSIYILLLRHVRAHMRRWRSHVRNLNRSSIATIQSLTMP